MHILLLSHFYRPEVGAASRRLGGFVDHWRAAGHRVTVLTGLPHYPEGRIMGGAAWRQCFRPELGTAGEVIVRVPFLPTRRSGAVRALDQLVVSAFATLPGLLCRPRPDIIVASVPAVSTMASAMIIRRRRRIPLVVDLRDAWPDILMQSKAVVPALLRPVAWTITALQRSADMVVLVPEYFRARLVERGIQPDRIAFIRNGLDLQSTPVLPPPTANPRPLRVLYLGTVGRAQDIELLVRAAARLGGDCVDVRIVGHGAKKASAMALARELGAPVTFQSQVAGTELWATYDWADTCCVPVMDWPILRDVVPAKMYEIMACGRHVTACIGGTAEPIFQATGCGLLVEPGNLDELVDGLRHLFKHRDELRIGGLPRAWIAANADVRHLADDYLEILTNTIDAYGRR